VLHAQKLESLGVMAGGIAHDFNNLLTGILGNLGIAMMHLQPNTPAAQRLERAEKAALRASGLTNQMLAYSGRGHVHVETVDLSLTVKDMAHLVDTAISKKAVLRYDFAVEPPFLSGDPGQIRQILMNLLTNASEALGEESGVITVRTGMLHADRGYLAASYLGEDLPAGEYVFLEVEETGCGMDRETLAKIFDPFFSTKFTGRGLGLAALLGIVRGHHGTVRVDSAPGRGTSFRVLFPRLQEREEPPRVERDHEETRAGGGGTILVIDDEEEVRDAARAILERFGYRVLEASDGEDGVERYREHAGEIDAVLLDLSMPRMDGVEVFREIRQIRSDARVLLSSGYGEREAVHRLSGQGLAGFIPKPFRAVTLVEKLRRALEEAV
jgi:CheY-like chemotaxis protein